MPDANAPAYNAPAYQDAFREVTKLWWIVLCVGLLSLAAGVIVLIKPEDSLTTITVVIGIFVVIDGLVALASAISKNAQNRGLLAVVGALSFIVGVLLIRHPIGGVVAVALLFGIWLIVMGAMRFVLAFDFAEHRGWRLLVAAIEIIAGIVIVSSPGIGLATLALLIGITLIAYGASLITMSFILRSASRQLQRSGEPRSGEPASAL